MVVEQSLKQYEGNHHLVIQQFVWQLHYWFQLIWETIHTLAWCLQKRQQEPTIKGTIEYTTWKGSMAQLPLVLVYNNPLRKSHRLGVASHLLSRWYSCRWSYLGAYPLFAWPAPPLWFTCHNSRRLQQTISKVQPALLACLFPRQEKNATTLQPCEIWPLSLIIEEQLPLCKRLSKEM